MRKRNIVKVADTVFWWIVYSLPLIYFVAVIIAYVVSCNGLVQAGNMWDITGELFENQDRVQEGIFNGTFWWEFDQWYDAFGDSYGLAVSATSNAFDEYFYAIQGTPIYDALSILWTDYVALSGMDSFINIVLVCFTWFIYANIVHLGVDFLLFIPRLAHKWLGKATQED